MIELRWKEVPRGRIGSVGMTKKHTPSGSYVVDAILQYRKGEILQKVPEFIEWSEWQDVEISDD